MAFCWPGYHITLATTVSNPRGKGWHQRGEQDSGEHTSVLVGLPPIGTVKILLAKRLKGALETTLEISEGE